MFLGKKKLKKVSPHLGLDQGVLDERQVGQLAQELADLIAPLVLSPGAAGEAVDPLVLAPHAHQVEHGGVGAPLGHTPEELASLKNTINKK